MEEKKMERKNTQKMPITDLDRQGFKFLSLVDRPEWQEFMTWLEGVRAEINKIDKVIPVTKIGFNGADLEVAGATVLVMRAKSEAYDAMVKLIKSLQMKYEQESKEDKDGEG